MVGYAEFTYGLDPFLPGAKLLEGLSRVQKSRRASFKGSATLLFTAKWALLNVLSAKVSQVFFLT